MNESFVFLLYLFIVVFIAQPLSEILKLPVLLIYICAGIFAGPSGINLFPQLFNLQYFSDLGIVLLMFSAGLTLQIRTLQKNLTELVKVSLITSIVPGITGFFVGIFFMHVSGISGNMFIPLFLLSIFVASSVEVIIPIFLEFAPKMDRHTKLFSSVLVSGILIADVSGLLWFSGLITYYTLKNFIYLFGFLIFSGLFFVSIFKGLPILQEYIGKRFYKKPLGVEEQTRSLMALLIFVVFIGSLLHLHPIVCAFLVGISLANVHIHRRVLHNINFVTFNIFVPIVFIVIGAEMNLSIFKEHQNYLYPIVLCLSLIFIRVTCSFIVARLSKFSLKKSMGFGFVSVPQLTGPLAMTIGAKQYGFISDTLFNSIIILSIVTTFIGPLLTKFLLFPGLRHRKKGFISLDEFLHLDIKPIPALTPLSTILSMVKDTELPVYPVIDENDAYMGVIHLEDVKNIVFGEELDRLVIATDVLDKNYPFICREILIEDAISLFKQPGILAIPVIEDCGKEKIYLGIILLKDILSFYS